MMEPIKHFDERVFESVISGGVDFYKVTSPLAKITEASEKTREKNSGRLVGGLVENDTINDTINLLSDNERTVFEEMQAHPEIIANELLEIVNINLRNTNKIIEKLKEKGSVERIGSRKTSHWEVVGK